MPAPTRKDDGLTRRDELAVSGAAMSQAPWAVAGAAGVVVTGGDLVLHLLSANLGLTSSLSAGAVAFFAVAAGGAALSGRSGRAMRWARAESMALRRPARRGLRDCRVRAVRHARRAAGRRRYLHRALARGGSRWPDRRGCLGRPQPQASGSANGPRRRRDSRPRRQPPRTARPYRGAPYRGAPYRGAPYRGAPLRGAPPGHDQEPDQTVTHSVTKWSSPSLQSRRIGPDPGAGNAKQPTSSACAVACGPSAVSRSTGRAAGRAGRRSRPRRSRLPRSAARHGTRACAASLSRCRGPACRRPRRNQHQD